MRREWSVKVAALIGAIVGAINSGYQSVERYGELICGQAVAGALVMAIVFAGVAMLRNRYRARRA